MDRSAARQLPELHGTDARVLRRGRPVWEGSDGDFGLYLDERWQPPWPHERVAWADFGGPDDPACLVVALRELLERARNGQRVEIGCLGGHGRTGAALACLAVLSGHPATGAVSWVRTQYCPKAVETDEQAAFVAALLV